MKVLTPVSKTMLATLKARYFASINPTESFYDKKAEYLINEFQFDTPVKYDDKEFIQCIVERAKIFDKAIVEIFKKEEHLRVINLGCGLCTRRDRFKELSYANNTEWYNIDTTEVIEVRSSILKEDAIVKNQVIKDLEDQNWIDTIIKDSRTNLFIMEGFSMYIEKEIFHLLLKNIVTRTKLLNTKTVLLFDYYHPNFQEYFLSNQYGVWLETKTGFKSTKDIKKISNSILNLQSFDIFKSLNGFQQLMGRTNFQIKNNFEEPYNIVKLDV